MDWAKIEKEFDVEVELEWKDDDILVFPYFEGNSSIVTLGKFVKPAIVNLDGEKWPGLKIGDDYFSIENQDDLSCEMGRIEPGVDFKVSVPESGKKIIEEIEKKGYIILDYWVLNFDVSDSEYIEAVQLAMQVSDGRPILVGPLLYRREDPWTD